MSSETEEIFKSAVNVIQNLPKNGMLISVIDFFNKINSIIEKLLKDGPFEPSTQVQLQFYSLYKQATQGPCNISRPSFYDIVGRAKWGAWQKLKNMPKEVAMLKYIELLKSIVETMAYNSNVETFLSNVGEFYEYVPAHDVDLALGDVFTKVKNRSSGASQPESSSPKVVGNSIPDTHIQCLQDEISSLETAVDSLPLKNNSDSPKNIPASSSDKDRKLSESDDEEMYRDTVLDGTDSSDSDEDQNFLDPMEEITTKSDAPKYSSAQKLRELEDLYNERFRRLEKEVDEMTAALKMMVAQQDRTRKQPLTQKGFLGLSSLTWVAIIGWPILTAVLSTRFIKKEKR